MNDEQTLPEEEIEDRLLEETAKGEGMVITPDDLPHAKIVVMRNNAPTDDAFEVRGKAVIGRNDDVLGPVDIDLSPLPEGTFISRKHAEIRNEDGRWLIKDLGSSNGTFVMGDSDFEKLEDEREITDGQSIAFGNVTFRFEVAQPEAPIAAPADEVPEPESTNYP